MTTGYFYVDHRQGGAVPARPTATTAGNYITVLDYIFTTGSNPWTKTIDGTNQVSYQAPGGSQIKLSFDNTYAGSSSLYMRVRATVGGTVFPSPSQETTNGYVLAKHMSSSTNPYGYYAIRTDRAVVILFASDSNGSTNYPGSLVAGDMPVYDSSDPGLCVLLGTRDTAYPSTGVLTTALGCEDNFSHYGYAYLSKTGSIISVPTYLTNSARQNAFSTATLSRFGSGVPLVPIWIGTAPTQTTAANGIILRGYVPFIRAPVFGGGGITDTIYGSSSSGDTFSAGSENYELYTGTNTQNNIYALMKNDAEPLP